jgi:mannitol/fructose-specific phosphotransferase system IIA component (Ntr-type)
MQRSLAVKGVLSRFLADRAPQKPAQMSGRPLDYNGKVAPHTLADYTSPGLLIPRLGGKQAETVIRELAEALYRGRRIADLVQFYEAALKRETVCSTITDMGWALPHARTKLLERPWFAMGRTESPIPWLATTGPKVEVIFLVAAPEMNAGAYLTLIAGVARLSKEKALIESLLQATDSEALFDVFKQVKLRSTLTP